MAHTAMKPGHQAEQHEAAFAVASMPGDWGLTTVVRHRCGAPRRWVASRIVREKDEKTGDTSETRQFESRVDVTDLLGDIRRRNIALGIERGDAPKEVR